MAKRTTRKTLNGTKKQPVGRASYLVINNPTGSAGNVLMGVRRPTLR